MSVVAQLGRYIGGAIALGGLAFSAAFVGRRTAAPVVSNYVELTIWIQLGGILVGLAAIVVGLRTVGYVGDGGDSE